MNPLFEGAATPAERRQLLEDHADAVEETTYYKTLSEDELITAREKFATVSADILTKQNVFSLTKTAFTESLKPLTTQKNQLLIEICTRQKSVTGKLYHVRNYESSMLETYDADGALLASRRLRPAEKQLSILTPQIKFSTK